MNTLAKSGLVTLMGLVLATSTVAQTRPLSPQEAARKERKAVKDYEKEVKKAVKDAAKETRFPDKPGVGKPPGKGEDPEAFDFQTIKPSDLGLTLKNEGAGIVIAKLNAQGVLADLGFEAGDRIVEVDGHQVGREKELMQFLFADDVRKGKVGVTVVRGEREHEFIVAPMKLIERTTTENPLHWLGITLGDRASNSLRVADVLPQSPADKAGLLAGDELVSIDGVDVKSSRDVRSVVRNLAPGEYVIHVSRDATNRKLLVVLTDDPYPQ